jgi:hypothetical protein
MTVIMDVKKIIFVVLASSLVLGALLIYNLTSSSNCIEDNTCTDLQSCVQAGESVNKCNDAFIGV